MASRKEERKERSRAGKKEEERLFKHKGERKGSVKERGEEV